MWLHDLGIGNTPFTRLDKDGSNLDKGKVVKGEGVAGGEEGWGRSGGRECVG